MRFRRKKGFIKSPEEKERRRIPWGKILYLGILGVILIGFGIWGYERVFYIRGFGVLDSADTNVDAKLTTRITDIKCKINDRVSKGEPIVFLDKSTLQDTISARERELENNKSIFKQKIQDAENELKLVETARTNQDVVAEGASNEYKRAQKLLALEAITRAQFLNVESRFNAEEMNSASISTQLVMATTKLTSLKDDYATYKNKTETEIKQLYQLLDETILVVPRDGLVTKLYKQVGEMVVAGEPVVRISVPDESFIRTYFDAANEDAIKVGEKVKVVFQSGDKYKGVIRKVYSASLPFPPEYKEHYGPQEAPIVAEIVQLDGKEPWSTRVLGTKTKVLIKRF